MLSRRVAALVLVAGVVAAAGCGGGDGDGGGTGAGGGSDETVTRPSFPDPTTAPGAGPEEAAFCEEAVPLFDVNPASAQGPDFMNELADSMEALEPPAELAGAWGDYIEGLRSGEDADSEEARERRDAAAQDVAFFMSETCGMFQAASGSGDGGGTAPEGSATTTG